MSQSKLITSKFLKFACTECGMCDALSEGDAHDAEDIIHAASKSNIFEHICPGIGIDRSKLNIDYSYYSPLIGGYENSYIGFSNNQKQRVSSSSGGVITEVLCYLITEGLVDHVCIPLPDDESELSHSYGFTNDIQLIRRSAQSIYKKISAWGVVDKILSTDGSVAFVGLPDQIASLRSWQLFDEGLKGKVKFFIGPMVGIGMDKEVVDVIPKIAKNKSGIKNLRWRYGEWPGYLRVEFNNGEVLKLHKFYYNYMLPFFCSNESLLSDDFSNECADISVGDAWSPKYEKLGKGWSVVWGKTTTGDDILKSMSEKGVIALDKVDFDEAVSMHEHMIDFKKRGSKYRAKIYKFFAIPTAKYYSPEPKYTVIRYFIEWTIVVIIWGCRTKFARFLLPYVGQNIMGKLFSSLRIFWKKVTKRTKRKGLKDYGK